MTVSVADIHRWKPGDVREVFHAARSRAEAAFDAQDGIARLPAFGTWGGKSAVAAKDANERLRKDLDAQGHESLAVAHAARNAADDMQQVQDDLDALEAEAEHAGYLIDPVTSRVIPGPNPKAPLIIAIAEMADFQAKLDAILARAVNVDEELASAIGMATGATPIPAAPPGAPTHQTGLEDETPATSTGPSVLANLNRANDQAVLKAMERVKAAQDAINKSAADAYVHGAGSPEALAAMAKLPQLKKELADALDELGKIPDYSKIDPSSVTLGPDGNLLFGYSTAGQAVQVTGALKNGTGTIFDQGKLAYFTYKDGQLVATRFLDPGRAIADPEPLWTAVSTAVGAGPMVKGGQEAWLGLRALFSREGAEGLATVTGDTVLPHAVDIATSRAAAAADDIAIHGPGAWGPSGETFGGFSKTYQEWVTGRPIGDAYIVEGPLRPIKFDDFAGGALIDAKGNYGQFILPNGEWKSFFPGDKVFLDVADRQLAAAGSTPIVWPFAQQNAAEKVAELLQRAGITQITAVWKPMG